MRIRIRKVIAGQLGIYEPGDIIDRDEVTARALIAEGAAESVEPAVKLPTVFHIEPTPVETAALEHDDTEATTPQRSRARGRRG